MNTVEILKNMVDTMTPENWQKGRSFNADMTKACPMGHIDWALGWSPGLKVDAVEMYLNATEIAGIIVDQTGMEASATSDLVTFNDAKGTTFDDVYRAVRMAYEKELEKTNAYV